MDAGIEMILETRATCRLASWQAPAKGVGVGAVPLPSPPKARPRRPVRIIRGAAPADMSSRRCPEKENLLALLQQAEEEIAQGIFASDVHTRLEAAVAGQDFQPARMDRLRVRRHRAIAWRTTRLLRDLFQILPIPERLLQVCWPVVEPFPELLHYLVDMHEGRGMPLQYRPYDHTHLALSWVEREVSMTGQLQRPTPFGVPQMQSPPQWRTCLMIPYGLHVPLGQVCIFQGEAIVFMGESNRCYRLRENEPHRYGWHLLPSGAVSGVYAMGRLAEDDELSGALRTGSTCNLDELLGCGRGHVHLQEWAAAEKLIW